MDIRKIQDVDAVFLPKLGWKVIIDSDSILGKVVSVKYLTKQNFLGSKKTANASTMWKYILDNNHLMKKVCWIIGNGEMINYWPDIWMDESSLIEKISQQCR